MATPATEAVVRAGSRDLPPWQRLPILLSGFACLVLGLLAGEARIGWAVPLPSANLIALHGPLMVNGFLGTLIGLERAVAIARRPAYLGPAASAVGAFLLLTGASVTVVAALFTLGAIGLVVASSIAYRRQPALYSLTLVLAAAVWMVGNAFWLGGAGIYRVVPWWGVFLILTIAGERLELSRVLRPSAVAHQLFAALLVFMLMALALLPLQTQVARQALAVALLGLSAWFAVNDIARRTVRARGLTRYIAVCLLSGYAWLAVAGLIGLFSGGLFAAGDYDATLHAVFLGFVFSMVFAHAPIILPSVTRLPASYHPASYVHWALLQGSLVLRVLTTWPPSSEAHALAGALNGTAILLFLAYTVASAMRVRMRAWAA